MTDPSVARSGVLAAALGLMAVAPPLHADAPPAPAPSTVCSLSGRVCASRAPRGGGVTVWRKLPAGRRQLLWRTATAGSNLEVADDGSSLVEFYEGANLLESDARPGTPVITFHRAQQRPVVVTLGQVVQNPAALPRTVSHRHWASSYGYESPTRYVLNTVPGRKFVFDPRAGRPTAP